MPSPLSGLSSMATRHLLADLTANFETTTGQRVAVSAAGGIEAARRVREGEALDFVVLASSVLEALEVEGFVLPGSRVDVARSGIAVAVPRERPAPVINDAPSVKAAIRDARLVSYSSGPSGDHLQALWRGWGMSDEMQTKARRAPPGVPVASILARGEADLGFQQLSELIDASDIQIVGLLPADIQLITTFSASIVRTSLESQAAREVLRHLTSPAAADVMPRYGLQPPA